MNASYFIFRLVHILNLPTLIVVTPPHLPCKHFADCSHLFTKCVNSFANYDNTSIDCTDFSVDYANKSNDCVKTPDDWANTSIDLVNTPKS
jgi:hypothetical protein